MVPTLRCRPNKRCWLRAASWPCPRRGLSLSGWPGFCPASQRAQENQPCAVRELWGLQSSLSQSGRKHGQKTGVQLPWETQLCLRCVLSPPSGRWSRAASSTLLPWASGQSASKPTAASTWASFSYAPPSAPLPLCQHPLLGSWTISVSDPSCLPTLPSNAKTSTWATPKKQYLSIRTAIAHTNDKHPGVGPTQFFMFLICFCRITHGQLVTPGQHHILLSVPRNGWFSLITSLKVMASSVCLHVLTDFKF